MILQTIIVYLHSAYMRHSFKRSRHNTRNGITVEIPTQNYPNHRLYYTISFYQRRWYVVSMRYLQRFKARQTGEHLVVYFSQPILGQKPAKRKFVTSRNEAYDKMRKDCKLSCVANYNLLSLLLRVDKYH